MKQPIIIKLLNNTSTSNVCSDFEIDFVSLLIGADTLYFSMLDSSSYFLSFAFMTLIVLVSKDLGDFNCYSFK